MIVERDKYFSTVHKVGRRNREKNCTMSNPSYRFMEKKKKKIVPIRNEFIPLAVSFRANCITDSLFKSSTCNTVHTCPSDHKFDEKSSRVRGFLLHGGDVLTGWVRGFKPFPLAVFVFLNRLFIKQILTAKHFIYNSLISYNIHRPV